MMNCNPETVSTDYDTSSRLYFEPITIEDVLNVIDRVCFRGVRSEFCRTQSTRVFEVHMLLACCKYRSSSRNRKVLELTPSAVFALATPKSDL
jgi:hypothetical protein